MGTYQRSRPAHFVGVSAVNRRVTSRQSSMPAHQRPGTAPLLFSCPSNDALFREVALSEIALARSEGLRPPAARRKVQVRYPHADVQRQQDVSIGDDAVEAWFAFRDGRDSPSWPAESWWTEPGVARATVQLSGGLTQYNRAFRSLFGIPESRSSFDAAGQMLSRSIDAALWPNASWLRRLGSVTSTAVMAIAGGEPREVEFHAVWIGDRPKRYQLMVRTMDERDQAAERNAIRHSSLGVVSRKRLDEILRGVSRRDMARGERLLQSVVGDPWAVLVVCGVVRVYLATTVEPTVLYGRHGSLLGTHLGVGTRSLVLGLQAVTPTRILQIDPRRVHHLLQTDARFARAIAGDAGAMLRDLMRGYALRSTGGLGQRLAREILLLQRMHEDQSFVVVTEQQLADSVGSIRESVSRAMGDFRRHGWVATTRYGLIPLDADALRADTDAEMG